ncbi:MAG: plasmid replication initiator TrfA [Telluria sp.]
MSTQAARKGAPEISPITLAPIRPPQLPIWAESMRGLPNGLLRTALFGAIAKGNRRHLKRERLASIGGVEIFGTGERLDQSDLDLYLAVLHVLRGRIGMHCRVSSYVLLKVLQKTDSGRNRELLLTRLTRLRGFTVEIKVGPLTYIGGLIDEAQKDDTTKEWLLVLNPKLTVLFGPDQFTLIDWSVRRALSGHPLAQFLHGFYASHARPHPMRTQTLLRLAGSEDQNPRSANQTLRAALEALEKASNAYCQPFGYEIQKGLVHIVKTGSAAQRRHLAKKATGTPRPRA